MKKEPEQAKSDRALFKRRNEQLAENPGEARGERVVQCGLKEPRRAARVLIVDDDPEVRGLLATAIGRAGFSCDVAADGAEAITRIGRQAYDVVVADVVLPDLNGLELFAAVRGRNSWTRVIIMTGHGDIKSAIKAVQYSADDYILKPFTLAEFMTSLERSLERHKVLRQTRSTHEHLIEQIAHLQQNLETRSAGGVLALAKAIEARDPYTKEHSASVAILSLGLAGELGVSGKRLDEIGTGALLHDVGKIAVPDRILRRPAPLTPEEYEKIQQHPRAGYDILIPLFGPGIVTQCALFHHERWDGKGYPEGLLEEECPLAGRILGMGDAFDAMTSERPYRLALSESEALKEIKGNRGTQFDPQIADLFCWIRLDRVLPKEPRPTGQAERQPLESESRALSSN